jgi:hypothetical protein
MGIFTYYRDEEIEKLLKTSDPDINELLDELNSKIKYPYFIQEREVHPKRGFFTSWFTRAKPFKVYSLYAKIDSSMEVQAINFCQEHDWSLNMSVRKSYIVTYLLGILCGMERKEKQLAV